jgi:hypothetical protein
MGVGAAIPPTRTQKEEEVGRRHARTQDEGGRRSRPTALGLSEAKDDQDEVRRDTRIHNLAVLKP